MRPLNLIGQVFAELTVLDSMPPTNDGGKTYLCRCSCGNTTIVKSGNLRSGHTKSCGCLSVKRSSLGNLKHGHSTRKHGTSPTYNSWANMLGRCLDPSTTSYKRYGARGITVCPEWLQFENFLKDMGVRPNGLSLDRINNNGNYEPDNCKWSTAKEQANNRRARTKK